ncbi:hypothetical protein SRHO_G00058560 [Serrasalmus rhombeus]
MRRTTSLRKRVGASLYWLATGVGYHTLSNLFGIGKASVCLIIRDFCKAVHYVLMPDYISLPQDIFRGFRTRWGFHIPIIAPENNHCDYFNRKGHHSVRLQGLVDHQFWTQKRLMASKYQLCCLVA